MSHFYYDLIECDRIAGRKLLIWRGFFEIEQDTFVPSSGYLIARWRDGVWSLVPMFIENRFPTTCEPVHLRMKTMQWTRYTRKVVELENKGFVHVGNDVWIDRGRYTGLKYRDGEWIPVPFETLRLFSWELSD